MARLPINIGTEGNDATGDSIREAFRKTNENFTELYTSLGLGDKLKFTELDDVPNTFNNQAGKIMVVNPGETALEFVTVEGAGGINVSTTSTPGKMIVTNTRSSIITDTTPQLGGDLNAGQLKIYNLQDPSEPQDALNLRTGLLKAGDTMTGPLILARDPITTDDATNGGLIAATKRYVDNSSFYSRVNFYVSTSGTDYREDLTEDKRGRAQAYAFKSIQRACSAAESVVNATPLTLGTYQKVLTYDAGNSECTVEAFTNNGIGTWNLSLFTNTLRTDFENDLRPGLYVQGSVSGALAKIVAINPILSGANEIFEVIPEYGTFIVGESVKYGDAVKNVQITILVEAGTYHEDFPLRLPTNTSIVGDEFRRAIIKPRDSISASPWANILFRRDKVLDNMRITDYIGENLATFTTVTPSAGTGTVTITLGSGTADPAWVGGFFRAAQGSQQAEGIIKSVSTNSFVVVLHDDFVNLDPVAAGEWTVYQTQEYGRHYLSDITKPIYPVVNYGNHVSAARILQLNKKFIQAEVVAYLDYTYSGVSDFSFDQAKCQRDVNLIIDAVTADMVLGTNYRSITAGLAYLRSYSSTVTTSQKAQTIAGVNKAKQLTVERVSGNEDAVQKINDLYNIVIRIITNGLSSVPTLSYPNPLGLPDHARYAKVLIQANKEFIKQETISYISSVTNTALIPNYNSEVCKRDVGYIVDALLYDLLYGGNSQTVSAALAYLNGTGTVSIINNQETFTVTAYTHAKQVIQSIARDQTVTKTTTGTDPNLLTQVRKATLGITDPLTNTTSSGRLGELMDDLLGILSSIDTTVPYTTPPTVPTIVQPTFTTGPSELRDARTFIMDAQTSISAGVVAYINTRYSGAFTYNKDKCYRDVGIIVDAMAYDLTYGGGNRSIASALTYYQAAASLVISDQLFETTDAYRYLTELALTLVQNPQDEIPAYPGVGSHAGYKYQIVTPQGFPRAVSSIVSFSSTAKTITSSNINVTNFLELGFQVGDIITVSGSTNNNDTFTIFKVTESTITVSNFDTLTTEEAGDVVTITNNLTANAGSTDAIQSLSDAIIGVINNESDFNPPLRNDRLDVFLTDDAVQLRNLTVQGHGGFMMVLDPEGQIKTKSPYAQTCSSITRSINRQIFAGGQYVDGFAGNIQATVTGGIAPSPQTTPASYKAINVTGMVRPPQTPCEFVINGTPYTVITASNWNPATGSVTLNLSGTIPTTEVTNGTVIALITAGNRSMLANDFTQVNDLGYGLIANNNGLIEAVSVFTYYNFTAYYSLNGGQIRSLNGSCAYGVNGLKSEGSDPLEIPDDVYLKYDLVQTGNIWSPVKLDLNAGASGTPQIGGTITQASTGMSGTILEFNAAKTSFLVKPFVRKAYGRVIAITGGTNTGTITSSNTTQVNFLNEGFAANQIITIYGTTSNDGTYKISGNPTANSITLGQKLVNNVFTSTFSTVTEAAGSYIRIITTGTFTTGATEVLTGISGSVYPLTVASEYQAATGSLTFYVDNLDYLPNNSSEIEIVFVGNPTRIIRYEVSSASLVASVDSTVNAGSFQAGQKYTITDLGNTNWNSAAGTTGITYTVGQQFIAAAIGSGTGKATLNDGIKNNPTNVYKLNLASAAASVGSVGLFSTLPQGHSVIIRQNRTLWLRGLKAVSAVRPSTALVLQDQPDTVYRVLSFSLVNSISGTFVWSGTTATISSVGHGVINGEQVIVSFAGGTNGNPGTDTYTATVINANSFSVNIGSAPNQNGNYDSTGSVDFSKTASEGYGNLREPYNSIIINDYAVSSGVPYPAGYGDKGDTGIACIGLGVNDIPRIVGMKFAWDDTIHTVTSYLPPGIVGGTTDSGNANYGILSFTPALTAPFQRTLGNFDSINAFRAVQVADVRGDVSVNISTMRATGHDFLDIGTGGYADSNYPNNIYGPPVNSAASAKEVVELGKGRVFYVSTDQDGNFKVGEFFRVDQGTGTVTFSASIALSNLNGLGFKRGVAISEFSTDDTMTDNAADTIPTEQAVRGYIDRRLGISHTGGITPGTSLIPAGGGFLDLRGLLTMTGNIKMGGNTVTALGNPNSSTDAVPYNYLRLEKLLDFNDNDIQAGDFLVLTGNGTEFVNSTVTGPVTFDLQAGDSTSTTIRSTINAGVITNAMFSSNAGDKLALSKVDIPNAGVGANAGAAVKGLASFDSSQFTANSGFIQFTGTIQSSSLAAINAKTVLGNNGSSASAPTAVSMDDVVISGKGIRKTDFTSTGVMTVNSVVGGSSATFGNTPFTASWSTGDSTASIVQRDSNGDFYARTITLGDQGGIGGLRLTDGGSTSPVRAANLQSVLKSNNIGGVVGRGEHVVYGYGGQAAIQIQDGTSAFQRTIYSNTEHQFRARDGAAAGTINVGSGGTLTTGGATTTGYITGYWELTGSSRLQATYADLAEYYSADKEYPAGWVVMFGGNAEVTAANVEGTTKVAGVVSTDPAYTMNSKLKGTRVCLALQGRVPCRVVGKVKKGDLMIASGIPGVAISAGESAKAGTIIGKALEDYDDNHIGLIEVAVGRL